MFQCFLRCLCSMLSFYNIIPKQNPFMVFYTTFLQPRSFLETPPPSLLPDGPLEHQCVLAAQRGVAALLLALALALASALGPAHSLIEQLAPEHVRQPHDPRAHCRPVTPVLALAPAARYLLGEAPQPRAYGAEGAAVRVAGWLPLWRQA